jgi:nicotinic acid phosphoribosyltransferase
MSNLGKIYFNDYPNFRKAFYYFSESLKMDSEDPLVLEYAIRCLKNLGEDSKAESYLRDMENILPQRYNEMKEYYADPNWRNYEYPFGWESGGDYPRKKFKIS